MKKKKTLFIILIIIIFICIGLAHAVFRHLAESPKTEKPANQPTAETISETETADEQHELIGNENDDIDAVEPEETLDIYDSNMTFDSKDRRGKQKVGNITVYYNPDDAITGDGTAAGAAVEAVNFHDGHEGDVKGYIFAVQAVTQEGIITSIEDAQDCVNEYIPAGSGIMTEWEEVEDFFVRKVSGYDNDARSSFIFLTVIPKNKDVDEYMYGAVYTMSRASDGIRKGAVVKESSFRSMEEPLKEHVSGSELIQSDYEEVCDELLEILEDKTATGQTMDGVKELRDAAKQWYKDVYDVESLDELDKLSEEEKKELYWKYKDPVGYQQAMIREGKIQHFDDETSETEGTETKKDNIEINEN